MTAPSPDGERLAYAAYLTPTRTERLGHSLRRRPILAGALGGLLVAAATAVLLVLYGRHPAVVVVGAAATGCFGALITYLSVRSSRSTPLNQLSLRDGVAVRRALRAAHVSTPGRVPAELVALAADEDARRLRSTRPTPWIALGLLAMQLAVAGWEWWTGAAPTSIALHLGLAAALGVMVWFGRAQQRRAEAARFTAGPAHGPG